MDSIIMINDSITTLLCLLEEINHPMNHSIPTPINPNPSFYMDSFSYPSVMRTSFGCQQIEDVHSTVQHQEVLMIYLKLLIQSKRHFDGSVYYDSIQHQGYQYTITIDFY